MSRASTVVAYYGKRVPRRAGTHMVKMPVVSSFTARRTQGTISRGYTRRSGFYGRYNMGGSARGEEMKFLDTATTDTFIDGAGAIIGSVNLLVQGTSESERIGRKCEIKQLDWRYRLTLPEVDAAATPQGTTTVRLIVYQDKQTNGVAATVANILTTAATTGHYNLENKGRFKILMDRTTVMNSSTLASDGAGVVSSSKVEKFGHFFKKCSIILEQGGTTADIVNLRSNNVGILAITSGGSTSAGLAGTFRIRYTG